MIRKAIFTFLILLSLAACVLANEYNVLDYGAKGDNKTDCTKSFQAAIDNAAQKGGGTVIVPTGEYVFQGSIKITAGVLLQGTYKVPPTNGLSNVKNANVNMNGSVLAVFAGKGNPDGTPFITLEGSNAGVKGLIIHYPDWKQETVPPIPYPPCIAGFTGSNQSVTDCMLLNPYVGIKFVGADRMYISNVYGYPIKTGVFIDQCYDICRIENCHFWPFNVTYNPEDPYCKWINQNGTAFEFARDDWQYVYNTFCFGYGSGYKFTDHGNGGCNGNFLGIGADSCTNAVAIEAILPFGLLITNGEFVGRWTSTNSCPIDIRPNVKGKISLMNSAFWGPIDTAVRNNAPNALLSIIGCNFHDWDVNKNGTAAITLNAGNNIIQGNTFADKITHINIGKDTASAAIIGNYAANSLNIINNIGKNAEIAHNIPNPVNPAGDQLKNYSLRLGESRDTQYIKNFIYPEAASQFKDGGTMRWSSKDASITLPVIPNTKYTVTFDTAVLKYALAQNIGIYLNGKRIIPITKEGVQKLSANINSEKAKNLTFTIKVKEWQPSKVMPGDRDQRILGIAIREITMISDPKSKIFNFNKMR